MKKIAILGAGAFGTGVANMLALNGHKVLIWARENEVVEQINQNNKNPNFTGQIPLSENLSATNSLSEVFDFSELVVQAVPILYLRDLLEQCKDFIVEQHRFVSLTKGLDKKNSAVPTEVIKEVLADVYQGQSIKLAAFAGPDYSQDLAAGKRCVVSVASQDQDFLKELAEVFSSKSCVVIPSQDLYGVQLVAAFKNVVALSAQTLRGAEVHRSEVAHQIYKCIMQLEQLLQVNNCDVLNTILAPAGMPDFMLTVFGHSSRNIRTGQALGEGKTIEQAIENLAAPPEGLNSLQPMLELGKKHGVPMPLFELISDLVDKKITLPELIERL